MKKSIREISWDATEEEYRASPAFSYSTLAKFYKKGPQSLISEEKEESASLQFGSLLDCLLTEPDSFKDRYVISEIENPSDTMMKIAHYIFEHTDKDVPYLGSVPAPLILKAAYAFDYNRNYKDQTKIDRIIKDASAYYNLLYKSTGKTIINKSDYDDAVKCVEELSTNEWTKKYIKSDVFDNTEHQYQIKFEAYWEGIPVRCMFDKLIVDHDNKTIQPIDFKTTSKNEEDFSDSYTTWCYCIQDTLYEYILEYCYRQDDYFKSFELLPFKFIVINRANRSPIIWNSHCTDITEEILTKNGYPTWRELLAQANWHVKSKLYRYSQLTYQCEGEREIVLTNLI